MRTSPENIQELKPNEIFVFGSNLAGRHGAGAALLAYNKFGARKGIGLGLEGKSYALPTKDYSLITLPKLILRHFVNMFIAEARAFREYNFLVTEVGCGLAGYEPKDIAPLFKEALNVENIYLPKRFIDILTNNKNK